MLTEQLPNALIIVLTHHLVCKIKNLMLRLIGPNNYWIPANSPLMMKKDISAARRQRSHSAPPELWDINSGECKKLIHDCVTTLSVTYGSVHYRFLDYFKFESTFDLMAGKKQQWPEKHCQLMCFLNKQTVYYGQIGQEIMDWSILFCVMPVKLS